MSLNKSTGNMYEFITHTWNTVKGECPHGCTYCYMKRFGAQKPVRFDKEELKTDLGSGSYIFVGSSCDMFADDIPRDWIIKTLQYCDKFDNKYLFQSKNPKAFDFYLDMFPNESVVCTTIETNRYYQDIMQECPTPIDRALAMKQIPLDKYVTIEPIMDFDLHVLVDLIKACDPIQVNVGADTGRNNLPEPTRDKLIYLIDELKKFTVINRKLNLKRLL